MAYVPGFDAFIEEPRFFFERHGPPLYERDARASANPHFPPLPCFFDMEVADVVVAEPALPVEVLPPVPAMVCLRIEPGCALFRAQPNCAGFFVRKNLQVRDRSGLAGRPRLGISISHHGGGGAAIG